MATNLGIKTGTPQADAGDQGLKILLYGLSGAGKTRTASLWPRPLFVDFDRGLASIDHKVAWVTMEKWANWTGWLDTMMTKSLPIHTVIIDSIPAMQRMAMESSVGTYKARRAHGDIPGQSDYGKMFWDVWRGIDEMLDLPYTKILITQCELGDFGEPHRPAFVGQAIHDPLLQAMDLIGYVEKTGPRECSLSFDRSDALTKDRPGRFTDLIMVNPKWADIEGRLKQRKTSTTATPKVQKGVPTG